MEPEKPYEIDEEYIKTLDGEKKYYSNGVVEVLKTPDGKEYNFNCEGGLEKLIDGSTTVYLYRNDDNQIEAQQIVKNFPDGSKKETNFSDDINEISVYYEKDDYGKSVTYLNNQVIYYMEREGEKVLKDMQFDEHGSLKRSWAD